MSDRLDAFDVEMMSRIEIYHALQHADKRLKAMDPNIQKSYDEEVLRYLEKMMIAYQRHGAALTSAERVQLTKLQNEVRFSIDMASNR